MKTLRILKVSFDCELAPHELPAFRAAIIEKAGREYNLFHNHLSDDEVIYRYPLIQYKILHKKPAIVCIDRGVEDIYFFFQKKNWDIKIGDKLLSLKVNTLKLDSIRLNVWEKNFTYRIRNWIALNQENYKIFKQLNSLTDKLSFLEKKFIGNILSMAKGVDWQIEKEITCKITKFEEPQLVPVKGQKLMGFNLEITTNVYLPEGIGLGKNITMGFGTIYVSKTNLNQQNSQKIIEISKSNIEF